MPITVPCIDIAEIAAHHIRTTRRANQTCQIASTYPGGDVNLAEDFHYGPGTRGRILDGVLYVELEGSKEPGTAPTDLFDRVVIAPGLCVQGEKDGIHVSKGACL